MYNVLTFYRPPVFKGQHGILGRVVGGWAFAPSFTASSGVPLRVLANGSTGVYGSSQTWTATPALSLVPSAGVTKADLAILEAAQIADRWP